MHDNLIDADLLAQEILNMYLIMPYPGSTDSVQRELETLINGAIYNMLSEFRQNLSTAIMNSMIDSDKYKLIKID